MAIKYPYSRQQITPDDIAAVTRTLTGPSLTQGPEITAFEREFAAYLGCREVVACVNGTAALHLAYLAVNLGPAQGLLTSPVTFLSTANAARMLDAPVMFADVDPETGNLDPEAVRRTLNNCGVPMGAITAVHLAGRPCDLVALRTIADEFGCLLIEDACHAPGAVYPDKAGTRFKAGRCHHSLLATFSFHAIKHIAMGEGGAVSTNDPVLAERMRQLRNHGMVREPDAWQYPPEPSAPWYYEAPALGFNYRITDFQCSLGRSQLRRLADSLASRRRIAAHYDKLLAGLKYLRTPKPVEDPEGHAWHLYPVAIDFAALGRTRGEVMVMLAERGVGTQVHYVPLYRQPYYRALGHRPLPGAEAFYAQTLSIPMYPQLTDADVQEIAQAIRETVSV